MISNLEERNVNKNPRANAKESQELDFNISKLIPKYKGVFMTNNKAVIFSVENLALVLLFAV